MAQLLTISEIKAKYSKDWAALSPQQAVFVTEWISGSIGNGRYSPVESARIAYPRVKNPAAWAGRLVKNKRVARVIELHMGVSETKSILFELRALLKRSQRKGANLDVLVAPLLKVAAGLEALAVKEQRS
jgi:hypothetical protein